MCMPCVAQATSLAPVVLTTATAGVATAVTEARRRFSHRTDRAGTAADQGPAASPPEDGHRASLGLTP